MEKYYLTTTGTVLNVNLKDLGLIFSHPTNNYDLIQRVSIEKITISKSLENSFLNGEITLKDESNNIINPTNYYQRKTELLDLQNKVKIDSLDSTADFLINKLQAGNNITLNEIDILGNKKIEVATINSNDKNFVFTQSVSTISVNVPHNLNKYCSVEIVDNITLESIDVFWKYIDLNNILVAPQVPITFKVICN